MEGDDEKTQMAYAQALSEFADAGGYDIEVVWDSCCTAALGVGFDKAKYRDLATLSGGEQKRLVLEYLLAGPDQVLLLDEPDNFLDVPGKVWLERRIRESPKTILFISHDRELLANTATRVVTVELGAAGNTVWTHPGGFASYHQARRDRFARFEELKRRWDEEHAKLKALVLRYSVKAEFNDGLASQYKAAQTRLRKFEEAGPPTAQPREQQVSMRLTGGRTGKRAVVCEQLELSGLMRPFDLEVWYGERVAVLGSNGSGKSHFLRLLAAGGSRPRRRAPARRRRPAGAGAAHRPGPARRAGAARAGSCRPTPTPSCVGRTLVDVLHRGERARRAGRRGCRASPPRGRWTATSWRTPPTRPSTRSPAASRRGSRSCCSSSPARRCCCSTSRPTTSTSSRPRRSRRGSAVRGHRRGGDPRPLVRPRLRPVPGVRRGRLASTSPTARCGTRAGSAGPAEPPRLDRWSVGSRGSIVVPAPLLVLGGVVSVQFGGALAATLVPEIGAGGSVLLRIGISRGHPGGRSCDHGCAATPAATGRRWWRSGSRSG